MRAIASATTAFAEMKDGEENKVGDCKIGTVAKLNAAVSAPSAYKYKGYVTIDTSDASKWVATNANTTFSVAEGVMSVTGKKVVAYTETIPNHNMITFDVKADMSGMLGFMVRSTLPAGKDDIYEGLSYFFWITSSKIELQADPESGSHKVIASLDSNEYIKSDTWHNIRIDTIDKEGGAVEIVLYVDGVEAYLCGSIRCK